MLSLLVIRRLFDLGLSFHQALQGVHRDRLDGILAGEVEDMVAFLLAEEAEKREETGERLSDPRGRLDEDRLS